MTAVVGPEKTRPLTVYLRLLNYVKPYQIGRAHV